MATYPCPFFAFIIAWAESSMYWIRFIPTVIVSPSTPKNTHFNVSTEMALFCRIYFFFVSFFFLFFSFCCFCCCCLVWNDSGWKKICRKILQKYYIRTLRPLSILINWWLEKHFISEGDFLLDIMYGMCSGRLLCPIYVFVELARKWGYSFLNAYGMG